MAKTINIKYLKESAVFSYRPIDRGMIYGKRRRVAFDEKGNECAKASLLLDGSLLIKSGMTAQGYFTPERVWVPQGELEALNVDGSVPELLPATVGEEVNATEIDPREALEMRFTTTYSLEPETLPEGMKKALDNGVILSFPFNPKADYHMETGILVSNDNGYFALIGEKVEYEFVKLASVVAVSEEAVSADSDDLDFEMF